MRLAPIGVGTLGSVVGWRAPLVAVGALGVAYAFLIALALDEDVARARGRDGDDGVGRKEGLQATFVEALRPPVLGMFVFFSVLTMGTKAIQTFTPTFVTAGFALPATLANTAVMVFFSLTTLGILIGGVLADQLSPFRITISIFVVAAVIVFAAATGELPTTAVTTVPVFAIVGFFVGVALPSRDLLASAFSSPGAVGSNFGIVFTGLSFGGFVSPVLVGEAIDTKAARVGFLLIGVFYAVAAGVIAVLAVGSVRWA